MCAGAFGTRNQAAYIAGNASSVKTVATTSPLMMAMAIGLRRGSVDADLLTVREHMDPGRHHLHARLQAAGHPLPHLGLAPQHLARHPESQSQFGTRAHLASKLGLRAHLSDLDRHQFDSAHRLLRGRRAGTGCQNNGKGWRKDDRQPLEGQYSHGDLRRQARRNAND